MCADERRVKQILINLLSNAAKFTMAGGITVKIKRKGQTAEMIVKDTGIGIKDEDLPRLFNEFCTISEAHAINPNGTGLGLYLSKKFATLMNGSISVKSVYGKGTKFTVKLPLSKEIVQSRGRNGPLKESKVDTRNATTGTCDHKETELAEDMVLESKLRPAVVAASKRTVLVVDDNPISLYVVSKMLAKCFVESDKALNGKQAIEMVKKKGRREPYALIFMDINMPIMSGPKVSHCEK